MAEKKIQMIIRDSGLASRRGAEEMILEGRVTLNGQVIVDPTVKADPEKDHIKIDGKLLQPPEKVESYYLFNKPRHVVSTMDDPEGRPCVGDFVKKMKKHLFPVGRLDFDAEGLMVLTNDGQLAQKLSHPRNKIPRTYLVKVRGNPDDRALSAIKKGMSIGEGDRVGVVDYSVIKRQKTTTWIRMTLHEGKKNEIKRIFFIIRYPVRKLRRIAFGPFKLGDLATGAMRPLSESEIMKLKSLMQEELGPEKKSSRTRTKNKADKTEKS
ncbi:pseudouridine synthase [Desulfomonile tiedjei]|uniref:Pseudouridine synthase n=1 Tax=Desulfomonile tiedjei (strain ATCC 49306 / DSM 6799 / DCB-1) TaxID=706587 RepID=I4BZV3_DESTA|nr:pseudouridine synthase [Desulfomonile tiedjei]AFM22844.1 pseudouridine synthase family protein [Desulfomonile tiedjei DSM 6799]